MDSFLGPITVFKLKAAQKFSLFHVPTVSRKSNDFSVRKFAQLKAMGVYQTRQEQGQERTWLHLENYETFDIRNKDEKDEIFIGHLPVS